MVIKREKTRFRQKQIAAAVAKLIVKLGGEHVTIKNIALEIGLSEAAIYRHFLDKRAIYIFLIGYAKKVLSADLAYIWLNKSVELADPEFFGQAAPGQCREEARHFFSGVYRGDQYG